MNICFPFLSSPFKRVKLFTSGREGGCTGCRGLAGKQNVVFQHVEIVWLSGPLEKISLDLLHESYIEIVLSLLSLRLLVFVQHLADIPVLPLVNGHNKRLRRIGIHWLVFFLVQTLVLFQPLQ